MAHGNNSVLSRITKEMVEALMEIPAFRYMKAPVDTVTDLYEKYPTGNERNTFAFVLEEQNFFFYVPASAGIAGHWRIMGYKQLERALDEALAILAETRDARDDSRSSADDAAASALAASDSAASSAASATQSAQSSTTSSQYATNAANTLVQIKQTLGQFSEGLIYQEAVNNATDLPTKYPTPQVGWASYVRNEGYTYAWNGSTWINTGFGYGQSDVIALDVLPWVQGYAEDIANQLPEADIEAISQIVKDIWFEFEGGVKPDWFGTTRKPILRAVAMTTASFPIRIYLKADGETTFNADYSIDLPASWVWPDGYVGVQRVMQSKIIEGVRIRFNAFIDNTLLTRTMLDSSNSMAANITIRPRSSKYDFYPDTIQAGGGIKTILTNAGVNILYDPQSNVVIFPENTRVITYKGTTININAQQVPVQAGAYSLLFLELLTGNIVPCVYSSLLTSQQLWNRERFAYMGWVRAITGGNGQAYFPAFTYMVGDQLCGPGAVIKTNTIDLGSVVPQIFNPPLPTKRDPSQSLRATFFGSSWGMNSWWYLNKICQAAGIATDFSFFYQGSASFQTWLNHLKAGTSSACYTSQNGSDWVSANKSVADTIADNVDLCVFQQGAFQSADWNANWENQWSELLSLVKRNQRHDTVLGFNSTFTPAVQGNLAPYPNTRAGQKQWQQDNYNSVRKFITLSGIYNVIPNGALMWAVRNHPDLNLSVDLAGDGTHPDNGLPNYALAANFYETYVAPIYGISIDTIDWLPDASTPKALVSGNTWQPINTTQRDIIRRIIKLAAGNRFGFDTL